MWGQEEEEKQEGLCLGSWERVGVSRGQSPVLGGGGVGGGESPAGEG